MIKPKEEKLNENEKTAEIISTKLLQEIKNAEKRRKKRGNFPA